MTALARNDSTSATHLRHFMIQAALAFSAGILLGATQMAEAQASDSLVSNLVVRIASLTAVTGYERAAVDTLLRLLPGSTRDRAGNARLTIGTGTSKRLVVCPLDEPGYVVGGVRDDGYLTLRRVPGRVSPLFDQQIEGQRITIQGSRGPVPGVVAVRSIHLTRGRESPSEEPFSVDNAYVDVGAGTRADVARLGVRLLSPVTLAKRPHRYGMGLLAAPMAGRRAACAALLSAAGSLAARAKPDVAVTIAFAVEQELSQRGLATLANGLGPFEETVIVDGRPGSRGTLRQEPDSGTAAQWPGLGRVMRWSLAVGYAGTPVETVRLADADSLRKALVEWIEGAQ